MLSRCLSRALPLAAALAVVASAARAQSPIRLGLAGGISTPMGSTADALERGYNGTVTLAIKPPLSPLGLRLDGMYNQLKGADGALAGVPNLNVAAATANLTYTLLPLAVARLYLIGGAGYYRTGFAGGDDARTDVGYNGGAGLQLGVGRTQLFVEGRYHRVRTSDNGDLSFVPVTVGLMF
jgi:Ca2+-binding RTX toxin-like protein